MDLLLKNMRKRRKGNSIKESNLFMPRKHVMNSKTMRVTQNYFTILMVICVIFQTPQVSCQSSCTDPGAGGDLTIAEGTSCEIDLPGLSGVLDNLDVRGTLILMSSDSAHVTLEATTVRVHPTGIITADEQGFGGGLGPGAGNSDGSGGEYRHSKNKNRPMWVWGCGLVGG